MLTQRMTSSCKKKCKCWNVGHMRFLSKMVIEILIIDIFVFLTSLFLWLLMLTVGTIVHFSTICKIIKNVLETEDVGSNDSQQINVLYFYDMLTILGKNNGVDFAAFFIVYFKVHPLIDWLFDDKAFHLPVLGRRLLVIMSDTKCFTFKKSNHKI